MSEEKRKIPDFSKLVDAEIGRRGFLKLIGGTTAGMSLTGCLTQRLVPCKEKEDSWEPGIEKWVPSVCTLCPGGCGILVRVVDGRAVKIEGNPIHPVNRGGLCPRGLAGLQVVYHPDRIKGPMRVVGGRGSGKWESMKWEEAIEIVASKLKEIRNKGESHSVVLLNGSPRGLQGKVMKRFMDVYGSPNYVRDWDPGNGMAIASDLMQGIDDTLAVDLENSNFILSFESGLLEAWDMPIPAHRAYGNLRQGRSGPKAKIVHVDTRFSMTASKSDEWIPINPGTDGALALGIAYIMVREELYDKDFVEKYTFGFEDWTDSDGDSHLGFRNLLIREYRSDRVSSLTGVPVETIIRLAKEFGSTRPATAIGGKNAILHTNGAYTAMAIHSLNALSGSIDAKGGIKRQRDIPYKEFPGVDIEPGALRNLDLPRIDDAGSQKFPFASDVASTIAGNILKDKPYKVNFLLFNDTNPVFTSPDSQVYKEAFEKIPYIVSFSSLMDESTEYADLILPNHTFLELWQDIPFNPLFENSGLGVAQPAIKPLYNTMNTGDVFLRVAEKMGGIMAESLPWKDFKEVISYSLEGMFDARTGTIFTDSTEEKHIRLLEARGWWTSSYHSYKEFWKALLEKGGWWDPVYFYGEWRKIFETPSRKFEFYSQRLQERLEQLAGQNVNRTLLPEEGKKGAIAHEIRSIVKEMGIDTREDMVYLPHFDPPRFSGNDNEFPLHLIPYELLLLNSGEGASQPWLLEIVGFHLKLKLGWGSWVEINPETAKDLGVLDGDWVWVESQLGKIKVKVRTFIGAMPGVVNIPIGMGHQSLGRWAENRGVNPNSLIEIDYDFLGGKVSRMATKVKVYKA
jgi:anaerobic selenocysteine-containing dehydrogenase